MKKQKGTAIKEVMGFSSAYPNICNLKLLPNIDGGWITIQDDVGTSMTIKLSDLLLCKDADKIIKALEQEPCDDAISRKEVIDTIYCECSCENLDIDFAKVLLLQRAIKALPPVTPQPKMGAWVRMSDLSEDVDDRYKCSKCGNVVHSTDRINLYTFHRWCGRCGSNNDVAKMQEVEE